MIIGMVIFWYYEIRITWLRDGPMTNLEDLDLSKIQTVLKLRQNIISILCRQESESAKKQLTQIYVDHTSTGKSYGEYETAMDRDNYLSPNSAKEMGLIDQIIVPKGKTENKEQLKGSL